MEGNALDEREPGRKRPGWKALDGRPWMGGNLEGRDLEDFALSNPIGKRLALRFPKTLADSVPNDLALGALNITLLGR